MRAYFRATGIGIVVGKGDREKDRIECVIQQYKNPRVFLNIVDEVESEGLEEPGFHIQCWPPNVNLARSTKIYVYLSRKIWHELKTRYDTEADGGFFCSRCRYDRFHIHYYDMDMTPQN